MSPALFERFHAATGLDRADPREPAAPEFMALVDAAEALFRRRTTAEWLSEMRSAGVPCAPYLMPFEAVGDVQVRANGYVEELDHPAFGRYTTSGTPLRFGGADHVPLTPSPMLGQHTEEIMAELGFSAGETAAMLASGVVAAGG